MAKPRKIQEDSIKTINENRKITLDSNILISAIVFKTKPSKDVITKSMTQDQVMMTSIIYEECMDFTEKGKSRISKQEMEWDLKMLFPEQIIVEVPSDAELRRMYFIADKNDYKILYSADITDSKLLITGDKVFFKPETKGPEGVTIILPSEYLNEPLNADLTEKAEK